MMGEWSLVGLMAVNYFGHKIARTSVFILGHTEVQVAYLVDVACE